jgi:hypothetical protein
VEVKEEEEDSYEEAEEEAEEAEEAEEEEEEEGEEGEEAEEGQHERHAQAPGGISEGRVDEDADAVAPRARRARLLPVRYSDYEEEEEEEEAREEGEDNGKLSGTTRRRRRRRNEAEGNGVSWRTSQFKGVCWDKREGAWRASCRGRRQGLTLVHS